MTVFKEVWCVVCDVRRAVYNWVNVHNLLVSSVSITTYHFPVTLGSFSFTPSKAAFRAAFTAFSVALRL